MYCIVNEGFITYGGMSGRDMLWRKGLYEGTEFDYLETRIKQVEYLAGKLDEYGIPYQRPAGDTPYLLMHAKFYSRSREEFIVQTWAIELSLEAGIRGVELALCWPIAIPVTGQNRYPELELLRLAIPRRTYTNNHMDVRLLSRWKIKWSAGRK